MPTLTMLAIKNQQSYSVTWRFCCSAYRLSIQIMDQRLFSLRGTRPAYFSARFDFRHPCQASFAKLGIFQPSIYFLTIPDVLSPKFERTGESAESDQSANGFRRPPKQFAHSRNVDIACRCSVASFFPFCVFRHRFPFQKTVSFLWA